MIARILPAAGLLAAIALGLGAPALAGDAIANTPAIAAKAALVVPENPREAGARYGQAAGVALLCYGMRTTGMSDELKSKYQGEALAAFNDQSERILAMWKDTLSCKHAGGPNQCRLSHAFSCAEAMKEIGPNGSKLPGLVEAKPEGASAEAGAGAVAGQK